MNGIRRKRSEFLVSLSRNGTSPSLALGGSYRATIILFLFLRLRTGIDNFEMVGCVEHGSHLVLCSGSTHIRDSGSVKYLVGFEFKERARTNKRLIDSMPTMTRKTGKQKKTGPSLAHLEDENEKEDLGIH